VTKQYHKSVILILLISLRLDLTSATEQSEIPKITSDHQQVLNLAIFIRGDVGLKRKGWASFVPVAFGTSLQKGDLLKVEQSSSLKVVCSDLSLHEVLNGLSGIPCAAVPGILLVPDGSLINPTRGGFNDRLSPTVLSPRKTKLLSGLPLLRWTPVEGAKDYTVIVRSYNFSWTTNVSAVTETTYPAFAPQLKAGVPYKLIVQTGGNSSADEPGFGLGFSIIGESERKTVEQEQRKIVALGLPEGQTQFITAYLYDTHGLESEAILKLESASRILNEPAVARFLADCYLKVGLIRKAEEAYLNALQLAKADKDEEGQALTHIRLGDSIYWQSLHNQNAAATHLNAALTLARKIGDQDLAGQAEKALAALGPEPQARGTKIPAVQAPQ
jgi:hypothetical protein